MSQSYSAEHGRRFGITLGSAFAVIGAFTLWRGQAIAPKVLGGLGLALLVAALAAPRSLELVEPAWMKLAFLISRLTTPIFLALVYFGVLAPMGKIRRTVGRNPLVHAAGNLGYWMTRPAVDAEKRRRSMERQF